MFARTAIFGEPFSSPDPYATAAFCLYIATDGSTVRVSQ
jgi:hypothetical protein